MLVTPLHQVASGRIFVRAAARAEPAGFRTNDSALRERLASAQLILGVVEIPTTVDVERMHSVRLNSSLWLDAVAAHRPNTSTAASDLAEMDMANILTDVKFSVGALPDAFQVFVRATHLKHDHPGVRWAYVAGLVAAPLEALPKQGLYEFDSGQAGFRMVSKDIYAGDALSAIFRRPLWGPGGRFGMATSMEPKGFPAWLVNERAMQGRRSYADPLFEKYKRVLFERHPELADQLVYTAEQDSARNVITNQVLREVMLDGAEESAEPAPQHPSQRLPPAGATDDESHSDQRDSGHDRQRA